MSSRTCDQIDFTIYHCETPFVGMGSCADVGFGGPATGALPEGWIEKLDVVSGRLFYFHEKHPTFSTWDRPVAPPPYDPTKAVVR